MQRISASCIGHPVARSKISHRTHAPTRDHTLTTCSYGDSKHHNSAQRKLLDHCVRTKHFYTAEYVIHADIEPLLPRSLRFWLLAIVFLD